MTDVYHPTTLKSPMEQVREQYLRYTYTATADPAWHFEIGLPKSVRMAPPGNLPPMPGGDAVTLAFFNAMEPSCDIEVYGQHLTVEVNPSDLLELFLKGQSMEVLSRRPTLAAGGVVGDMVVRWKYDEQIYMGRFFSTKVGPRLVTLWFRAAEGLYAQLADSMLVTITSFRMLDTSAGPFTEKMQPLSHALPMPWKMELPASWEVKVESETATVNSFQANLPSPGGGEMKMAQLSVSIIANQQVTSYEFACNNIMTALREAGIALAPTSKFYTGRVALPYLTLCDMETSGSLQGQSVMIKARLLQHPRGWLAAAVVGPAVEVSPVHWMQARRVLDAACQTLEFA